MPTLLIIAACAILIWWGWKTFPETVRGIYGRLRGWLGQVALLGLAVTFAMQGRILYAAVAALVGIWLMVGGNMQTLHALIRGRGRAAIFRSPTIELVMKPSGTLEGKVRAGPNTGKSLDSLGPADLFALARLCAQDDPEGFSLLEPYLDRRLPGWRQHVDGAEDLRQAAAARPGVMTAQEAEQILGLQPGADAEAIRTAHRTLMKRVHPDQGGSTGLAARVNEAKDVLMRRHR